MEVYNIYKIYVGKKIYIGATKQEMHERWWDHKSNARNPGHHMYHYPIYQEMRKVGIETCRIELIREVAVANLTEAHKEEQKEIEKYSWDVLLNDRNAYQTPEAKRKIDLQRLKEIRDKAKADNPEEFLKAERAKRNEQRAKLKKKDPEAYLQKQRDYIAKKKKGTDKIKVI
jgi:hypothetical protein